VNTPRPLSDWLAWIERQHPKSIDMGLERVRAVAARMGLGKPARHVITVGGTNGKGSTVAFIEAIARAAGWKVGAYTSPHLLAYNERVRIDGHDADDAALVEAFETVSAAASGRVLRQAQDERVREHREFEPKHSSASTSAHPEPVEGPAEQAVPAIPLTYFEYGTLAALWLFERADLDLAILEVGLGGRLDAVNLVDADVAVITTVDLDHQDYLGDDREGIGFEKAGIARAWKPLVLGEDDPPSSVLGHAYAIGAATWRAGSDFFFERIDEHHWRWREVGHELLLPLPALAASVQMRNAATAIAALRALEAPDKAIPDAAHAEGVAKARLPGRLQRFERDGVEIVVDVGHNPQAARELAAWLGAAAVPGRTFAVYAALGDKDVVGVANALAAQVDDWFLAGLEAAGPRGIAVTEFARRLAGTAAGKGGRHPDVESALAAARAQARPGDRILVFGSFHTVAAALPLLQAPGS